MPLLQRLFVPLDLEPPVLIYSPGELAIITLREFEDRQVNVLAALDRTLAPFLEGPSKAGTLDLNGTLEMLGLLRFDPLYASNSLIVLLEDLVRVTYVCLAKVGEQTKKKQGQDNSFGLAHETTSSLISLCILQRVICR